MDRILQKIHYHFSGTTSFLLQILRIGSLLREFYKGRHKNSGVGPFFTVTLTLKITNRRGLKPAVLEMSYCNIKVIPLKGVFLKNLANTATKHFENHQLQTLDNLFHFYSEKGTSTFSLISLECASCQRVPNKVGKRRIFLRYYTRLKSGNFL